MSRTFTKGNKMNKALKETVEEHSFDINKLFHRVSKIEQKVMRETYTVRASCPNCMTSQELNSPIGQKRPNKYKCDHCGCEVEPTVFASW
jgi:predicted RNA-binding Zn-ribbon protein involved in translation (DUF1610 family)